MSMSQGAVSGEFTVNESTTLTSIENHKKQANVLIV